MASNTWRSLSPLIPTATSPFPSITPTKPHDTSTPPMLPIYPPLEPRDTSTRYPDIAVAEDSETYYIDVSIVEPTSRHAISSTRSSSTTKGAAALSMERTKATAYANTEWRGTVPFVLESTGLLGKRAEGLLEHTTRYCPHLFNWFNVELSLLLARSEGRMRVHTQALLH